VEIEVGLKIIGIASGFYNPLTVAHIQMLEASKALVDELIVIVNNDSQVAIKKSVPFYSELDRVITISSLRCVDEAVLSIDYEWTIEKTMALVFQKHVASDKNQNMVLFLNGGDRCQPSEAELEVCKKYGILTVYGVGGYDKPRSSSELIRNAAEYWVKHHG
jgi:cytidyltransferase-like protein